MPDSKRAVEVITRGGGNGSSGYGSGYCLGAGLILTCAHILVPDASPSEMCVRDTRGQELPIAVAWRNREHDLALLRLARQGSLPESIVPLGILPSVTSGLRVDFVMWGWPRGGDVRLSRSKTVREAVQVDGEIKLAELAASKSGLVRLRPAEIYPALDEGSYWTGMSGAAVHCKSHIVGVQRQQPDLRLTGYLMARTFGSSVLEMRDGDSSGTELLEAAGIPLHVLTLDDVAPRPVVPGELEHHPSADSGDYKARPRAMAARPYMLLETGRVVGRVELQGHISGFIDAPNGLTLLLLVGVAGIGKSALAWDLWKQLKSVPDQAGRGLFWYSFYDGQGTGSFQRLLDELGRFLGIEASELQDSRISADDVLSSLAENPTVLMLDGIERCLRCYQRTLAVGDLDAIQVQEADATGWGDQDLAFSTDEVFRFFLQILELQDCQVIATSRVVPSDYLTSGSALRAGIRVEIVGALDAEECRAFLEAVGLKVEDPLSATISNTFGGHPLALQLFARRASRSPNAQRDLEAWMQREGYSLALERGATEIRHGLFAKAASELSPTAKQALVTVGALGGDLDQSSLFEIFASEDFTDRQFEEVVDELAASGLCVVSSARGIACHALTALAASDELDPSQLELLAKRVTERLAGRFKAIEGWGDGYYEWYVKNGISDRVEALALCRALVGLRRFAEAADVYQDQLDLPIRLVLGANFEAIELLSSMVSGLEEEDTVRWLRARLAHHLLMANRIHESEALIASHESLDSDAQCTAAEATFHLGRFDAALRLSTLALHNARSDINYALNYDYGGFQLMGGKNSLDIGGPSARFIEAAVLCARILVSSGRPGEAAMLLAEATTVSRAHHSQCDGCRGLILRASGEMLVLEGVRDLGMKAATYGKRLQESQGKALQGLFSEVVVQAKAILDSSGELEPDRELLDFLSANGFVLYQLILEAAAERPSSDGETDALPRAHRDLASAEARYAMQLLGAGDEGGGEAVQPVSVAGCVGWLVQLAAKRTGVERVESQEEEESLARAVDDQLTQAIQGAYRGDALALVADAVDDHGAPQRPAAEEEVLALLPVWERIDADRKTAEGDPEGAWKSLRRAVELDPCDATSLARLAAAAAESGDSKAAFDFARQVLLNATALFDAYSFVVQLVVEEGAFADDVRDLISQFAWDDHASPAAYLALANLERRLGRRREAREWHERGLDYPATLLGNSHRVAHHLGLALARHWPRGLRRYSVPPLGIEPKAELVASFLLDCALSGQVPQKQAFLSGCKDEEVTDYLYEDVRGWLMEESRRLEGGERFVELLTDTPT